MPRGVYKRTKSAWNKGIPRTEEEKEKQKETVRKKYGVDNVSQVKEVRDKISKSHSSDEWKQKVKDVKQQRYGDPNYNNMEKNRQTKSDRYGDEYYNNMDKMYQTKRLHHSFNTSRPEEELYQDLLKTYLKEDIVRQYSDERYPWKCDFYIKSEDLFIELNYHQGHGEHPYDLNNPKDIELVNFWRSRQNQEGPKNQYWGYECTFTVSDPLKLKTAKENNLNYLIIYRNGLEIKI